MYLPVCDILFGGFCLIIHVLGTVTVLVLTTWCLVDSGSGVGGAYPPFLIWLIVLVGCFLVATLVSNIFSFRWYFESRDFNFSSKATFFHLLQLAIPYRAICLIRHKEVRNYDDGSRRDSQKQIIEPTGAKIKISQLILVQLLHTLILCVPAALIYSFLTFDVWYEMKGSYDLSNQNKYSVLSSDTPEHQIEMSGISTKALPLMQSINSGKNPSLVSSNSAYGLITRCKVAASAFLVSVVEVSWAVSCWNPHSSSSQSAQKLILSWPGILTQFLWRMGTLLSRFVVIGAYGSAFGYFVFLVLGLHWLLIFAALLLIFRLPLGDALDNYSHGSSRKIVGFLKEVALSAGVAVIYMFDYINFNKKPHTLKLVLYYALILLENCLLCLLWLYKKGNWLGASVDHTEIGGLGRMTTTTAVLGIVIGGYVFGIIWMGVYHRFCNIDDLIRRYSRREKPNNLVTRPAGSFHCSIPFRAGGKRKQPSKFNPIVVSEDQRQMNRTAVGVVEIFGSNLTSRQILTSEQFRSGSSNNSYHQHAISPNFEEIAVVDSESPESTELGFSRRPTASPKSALQTNIPSSDNQIETVF